jgi:hypothetical protein
MTEHAWWVLNVGVTLLLLVGGVVFLVWVLWSLFWHLYDTRMENSKRIKNDKIDPAYQTGQWSVGRRDAKDL